MKNERRNMCGGVIFLLGFVLWTILIQMVDVKPEGIAETNIGFSTINVWFHNLTGVHMKIYTITDWLGLVAVFVCIGFGLLGLCQWIKRRSLLKVDFDIRMLGVFYVIVILEYLIFEMIPINYRIFIEGRMEASYPSSTTLLVLSVMPTLIFELKRRMKKGILRKILILVTASFSLFMVIGRTVAGVHWLTDIVGAILLSAGSYLVYREIVLLHYTVWSKGEHTLFKQLPYFCKN